MSILSTAVDKPDAPKKRRRRTKAEVEQLENQILYALERCQPQSVRHIYYLMTNPTLHEPVDKTDHGASQIQYYITKMRRDNRVKYSWITDATRRGYHVATYGSAYEFMINMIGLYRGELWKDSPYYVEVWVESRSIAGVVEDLCEELAVSLYPAAGFSSISLAYQAAEYINDATGYGAKPAEVLYIGDYDPAGVIIPGSVERELRRHLHPDVELNFHRIAITEEQIFEYDLPSKPRKLSEKRAQHVRVAVEAEEMPVEILVKLLREKVESYLPEGALTATRAAEESEREGLARLAGILSGGSL